MPQSNDRTTYNTPMAEGKDFKQLSKADQVGAYLSWIESSRDWRDPFEECWKLFYSLYRHKHPHAKDDCGDDYQINKVFSSINVILSSTALEFPKIIIEPRTHEDAAAAMIAEKLVNYFWEVYDYQEAVRSAYKDSLIIGHGWLKVQWRFEEESREVTDEEFDQRFAERRSEIEGQLFTEPQAANSLPNDDELRDEIKAMGIRAVTRDEPEVCRISPFDIYVDPEARDMKDVRWIAQRTRYTGEEMRAKGKLSMKNGGFSRSAVEHATTDDREDLEARTYPVQNVPEECEQWYTVWEFYDIARGTFAMFADHGNEFLRPPSDIPYSFGHPYIYFGNHEVTEELYDMGDVECIADLQAELNQTRSDIANHRRRYRVKYWYNETLGEDFKKAMLSNDEDIWAPVPDNVDPDSLMGTLPQVQVPPEFYNQSVLISQDIDEVSGITDFQRGRAPTGGTATEAAILNSASQARASEKLRRLERVMAKAAERVIMMAQDFMESEHVVRIAGVQNQLPVSPDGPVQQAGSNVFVTVDRELISGQFDFVVQAGSTQPNNEALRAQRAVQVLSLLTPFAAQGLVNINELLKWSLENLGITGAVERFLANGQPQPNGLQQAGTPPGGVPSQTPTTGLDNQQGAQTELPGAVSQLNAQLGTQL